MSSRNSAYRPVYISGASRTPIGGFQGVLKTIRAPELGAAAIRSALQRSSIGVKAVEEVLLGCVLPAGLGQAPARQAALLAGIGAEVPCTTVNKVCGSGMKTVMLAADAIALGRAKRIVAGGMESMSNAPYLITGARPGLRLGHDRIADHMFLDGLEDAYSESTRGSLMGTFAEQTAERLSIDRERQDEFAQTSLDRSREANTNGAFASEIAPISIIHKRGDTIIDRDEQPFTADPDKIPNLRPAFTKNGTVTAANSSSISDGAAALVLSGTPTRFAPNVEQAVTLVAHATHAGEPRDFPVAPIPAIQQLLTRVGWSVTDIDLWEINEAFAVVTIAAMDALSLPHDRVNVNGGATALGHPIGASGARIVVTLAHALIHRGLRRGVAALCIGGGEATAVALEVAD